MSDYAARETMYNGIPMRSRLEAGYAQWLDSQEATWTYEGKAFGSSAGQYLPDFTVHSIEGKALRHPLFIEVKAEGRGTTDVLERMKIILGTHPDATFFVVEGSWEENEYTFRIARRWPEPPPPVTYYVYNVPGCDSWHRLPQLIEDDWETPDPSVHKAIAEEVLPDLACWNEQEPRAYVLPDSDSYIGLNAIWAVAFHKGDAAIVSTIELPWLSEYLMGQRRR